MVKIVWTEQSVFDLKYILDYISKDSRRYAENQIRRIKTKTLILKTQPESGRIVPELGIMQIRELIEGNYRIVYRLLSNELIEILTIHHSARDFESREIEKIK
jgi:addiction module RelE/StbE family toxin